MVPRSGGVVDRLPFSGAETSLASPEKMPGVVVEAGCGLAWVVSCVLHEVPGS